MLMASAVLCAACIVKHGAGKEDLQAADQMQAIG